MAWYKKVTQHLLKKKASVYTKKIQVTSGIFHNTLYECNKRVSVANGTSQEATMK